MALQSDGFHANNDCDDFTLTTIAMMYTGGRAVLGQVEDTSGDRGAAHVSISRHVHVNTKHAFMNAFMKDDAHKMICSL